MPIVENEELIRISVIGSAIMNETMRATRIHGSFHSAHEGYAVIKEELDELWDEIRKLKSFDDHSNDIALYREVIQIGAMALRFAYDITGVKIV